MIRRLLGTLSVVFGVLLLPSPARAHELDTDFIEMCEGSNAFFVLTDPTGCSANVLAKVIDGRVATVDPNNPVQIVTGLFEVKAGGVGDTDVVLTFQGIGDGCTELGDRTVHIVVRPKSDPTCDMQLTIQLSEQGLNALNQRNALVMIDATPLSCECSRVILTQTIQTGTKPPTVDIDSTITGSTSPFYNYDPVLGGRIARDGFGNPGTCKGGNDDENAQLLDSPLRTSEATLWETCAICCDNGQVLACQSWRYDPQAPGGKGREGGVYPGRYYVGKRADDFSRPAQDAYRAELERYWAANPKTHGDACLANYRAALSGQPPPVAPPPRPPAPETGTSGGGCLVAGDGDATGGAGAAHFSVAAFVAFALVRGARRRRRS